MLERALLLPLSYYLLLAVGLSACLYLFLTLKREVRKLETRWTDRHKGLEATIRALRADLDDLNQRLRDAEERAGMLAPPPPLRSGLNLSKRTQALRLFARGESPEHIAAALSLPEGEVQLLAKVQRLTTQG
jgi:hypothetical protein